MTKTYDIIIGGGGITGSLMALALAGSGLTVALIDQMPLGSKSQIKFDGRAYALSVSTTRMLSVLNGLQAIKEDEDKSILVAVHDAARPCLELKDLLSLMEKANDEIKEDGQGCYLSYQPTESVNLIKNEKVQKSLDRKNVWLSATPQVFCLEDLLSALTQAHNEEKVFTDEVSAMLHYFKKEISIYPCNRTNIKVTKKEDLETIEQYLKLSGRI